MKKNILLILTGVTALLALAVIVALLSRPQPVVETEIVEKVRTVYVEETQEETTVEVTTEAPVETTVEETTQSVEELAEHVLNAGLNGDARAEYLGDRYDEVQALIDQKYTYVYSEPTYSAPVYYEPSGDALNPYDGINYYNGVLETYYDLPMEGLVDMVHALGIEGTYWVREDGVKMWDDFVIVAADFDYEPRGTITETSLGTGIVLDTGEGGWGWHDIAVEGW